MDANLVLSALTTLAERLEPLASGLASPGVLLFHLGVVALAVAPFPIARAQDVARDPRTRERAQLRRNRLALATAFAGAAFVLVVAPWGMLQATGVAGAFPIAWLLRALRSRPRPQPERPTPRRAAARTCIRRWAPQRSPRRAGSLIVAARQPAAR